ncbi:MAG: hypothetical protein NTX97_14270 [Bacteroidetes bacterium]|nr:hypothetical protein [Bacteroidota bacterium]
MKKSRLIFVLLAVFALSITGCKKEDSKPIVSVTPTPLYIYGNVGDLITFCITVNSDVQLSRFSITAQPDNQIPFTLLDTAITTKGTQFNYYYQLPLSLVGKSVVFDFKAEDQNGMTGGAIKRVYILAVPTTETILTETSGHRLYSNLSTNPDAYDLETNSGVFSTVADSTLRDIQDYSGTDTVLSGLWKSPAGGKFVLFNGFDYANATDSSAIHAYVSGVKLTIINNLQIGDIIITKLGSMTANKYAVIRITDIVDILGKNNDYYEFTIKK